LLCLSMAFVVPVHEIGRPRGLANLRQHCTTRLLRQRQAPALDVGVEDAGMVKICTPQAVPVGLFVVLSPVLR